MAAAGKPQPSGSRPKSAAKAKSKAPAKAAAGSKKGAPKKAAGHGRKPRESKDVCFVLSPYGGWHDAYHREIFCNAIRAVGLEPKRADDLFRSSNIVHDIWHLVASARVLLADLTGKNPNVFYELGLAHAARKPVLLVTQSMDDVPFDLRALRVITYDIEHPSWGRLLGDNIEQGLLETLESPERSVLPTFLAEEPNEQPKVTEDERRFLDLQQQVNSLRSEVRASTRRGPVDPDPMGPGEARALVRRSLARGASDDVIRGQLRGRSVPAHWIDRVLRDERVASES